MATTSKGVAYPGYDDDPDVPGDLQTLAQSVDDNFYDQTELDAALDLKLNASRVEPTIESSRGKLYFGTAVVTPNIGGAATITHGAGWTPDQVIATAADTDTAIQARKGTVCNVLSDTIGGTTFDVRVYRNDDGSAITSAIRINYICMKA